VSELLFKPESDCLLKVTSPMNLCCRGSFPEFGARFRSLCKSFDFVEGANRLMCDKSWGVFLWLRGSEEPEQEASREQSKSRNKKLRGSRESLLGDLREQGSKEPEQEALREQRASFGRFEGAKKTRDDARSFERASRF
jgi:hypothetical protein